MAHPSPSRVARPAARRRATRDARHFERLAPHYDRRVLQRHLFGPVQAAALDALAAEGIVPRAVLDIGCGTGRLLAQVAERWPAAYGVGVDPSAAMLREAWRTHAAHPGRALVRGDAAALPLRPGCMDAVVSTISFHHWRGQAVALQAVARVLRPGGLFVLADIDPPWPALSRPLLDWLDDARYQGSRTVRRMLEAAGFAVVGQQRLWHAVPVQLFVCSTPQTPTGSA